MEFKVDPGSKITGLALVALFKSGRKVVWGANLVHRGHHVKSSMDDRRMFRRGRRGRKTRYRPARFNNRTRP
ncbi:MAG: RRXRR domain-containing protein, partial [Sedimenticola sp.]